MGKEIIQRIEALTGQNAPFEEKKEDIADLIKEQTHFRHSQFNELLLTLGYDRISEAFFDELFREFREKGTQQVAFGHLGDAVEQFEKNAIRLWGNVKFAFKRLSAMDEKQLRAELNGLRRITEERFTSRPAPLDPIQTIPTDETPYLGYAIQNVINEKWPEGTDDPLGISERNTMKQTIEKGVANHYRYLAYDYLDVYVATSMRQRHEFVLVGGFIDNLFKHPSVKDLNLRYFDPTQAYCKNRIDKGLVEALMLKRCKCTIYHVQELDTLGKDSELAATLAQGKPVIAYVPEIKDENEFLIEAQVMMKNCYPDKEEHELILEQLQVYYPEGAWKDKRVRRWLDSPEDISLEEAKNLLVEKAKEKYDKRANMLSELHPLGLQVHLESGVANGVLVVRSVDQCARLLKGIILNELTFEIKKKENGAVYLKEKISNCTYRVKTGDDSLTNSFWNFYLS